MRERTRAFNERVAALLGVAVVGRGHAAN
jgi:hypothetical protein